MAKVRCSSCSAVFEVSADEPTMKCPSCGRKYRNPAYKGAAEQEKAIENVKNSVEEQYDEQYEDENESQVQAVKAESKFTGSVGSYIGLCITNFLLLLVTLTVAEPWVICRTYRWKITHQVIDGKRLSFDGRGGQLVGNYWWWSFLTVITIGIYGFWVPKKIQQWLTKHTYIEGAHRDKTEFVGGVGKHVGISITNGLLDLITLSFYAAWGHCRVLRWQIDNKIIEGHRMRFDGTGGELLGKWALYGLLNIITLGIYSVFSYVKMQQWITENIHFEN